MPVTLRNFGPGIQKHNVVLDNRPLNQDIENRICSWLRKTLSEILDQEFKNQGKKALDFSYSDYSLRIHIEPIKGVTVELLGVFSDLGLSVEAGNRYMAEIATKYTQTAFAQASAKDAGPHLNGVQELAQTTNFSAADRDLWALVFGPKSGVAALEAKYASTVEPPSEIISLSL